MKLVHLLFGTIALSSACAAFAEETKPFTTTVSNVLAAKGTTTTQAIVKSGATTVVSPRTGVRYTLGDTNGRPITLKTAAIAPVNTETVKRISASNPALSTESQQEAEQKLLALP
ncbi:MAG: hypothetical protein QM666_04195 [Acinetobacter sp.]